MSYATLMAWINVDHVSKQFVSVAAGVADKFAANLIGLSAVAIVPPSVAEGLVIVDNATEFDIAKVKASLAEAGNKAQAAVGSSRQIAWRSVIAYPTETLIREARCADLIVIESDRSAGGAASGSGYATVPSRGQTRNCPGDMREGTDGDCAPSC